MLKTSVIIPTYNRPSELHNCIKSILDQTHKPDEVIVIDDGNLREPPLLKECENAGIKYIYRKKDDPDMSKSRNEGVLLATGDIILFFDDDVILIPDYIEQILRVYENDKKREVFAVGGVPIKETNFKVRDYLREFYHIIFLISGWSEGKALPSGFYVEIGKTPFKIKNIKEVDFLPGCACSYRAEIFKELSFTNYFEYYASGEDKDFSYRVSRKYKTMINPEAKLFHKESPKNRRAKEKEGEKFICGIYILFKKHIQKGWWSWIFFYYALFGYTLARFVALIFFPNRKKIERLKGVLSALKDIFSGNVPTK